ncbi:MAG: TolC family protein, partial [Actinomycetota bacterium]|nr:TolC family protein [Actinomycetota bacterium]
PGLRLTSDSSHARRLRPRGARHGVARRLGHLVIPVAGLVAGFAATHSAAAQTVMGAAAPDTLTLSLADVQRLAVRQNPGFLVARQETAIAGGGLRQARVYRFNPDLALQATGATLGASGSPYELTLTQEIEWAGQRGLRVGAARTGLTRASAIVQNAGRLTLADASTGFYRALAAARRVAVARDALALTERLLSAVRTQLREGEISTLEGNLAEIEFGRARGRILAAQRAETSAALELKQLIGLMPDTPIRLVGDPAESGAQAAPVAAMPAPPATAAPAKVTAPDPMTLDEDSLIALALARRPDLAASAAAVREFETLTALARREALPNLRLGAAVERTDGDGSPQIGPAVGLSLPLFNRNQGLVDQRRALAEQARLDRRATELRIRTEVTNAVRAFRTASEEAAVFEASVLRPARENTELLETAFRAGKIALPTLLLLRNQLLGAELGYWDAWLARREALVQLHAAISGFAPPGSLPLPLDAGPVNRPESADSSRTSP